MSAFADLSAVFVNCSLERDSAKSHTRRLIEHAETVMRSNGVAVDTIHLREHQVAFGMSPDMTKQGLERDDWPALFQRIVKADILVVGSPIWLGAMSSVSSLLLERLYSNSAQKNDHGQYVYYGHTAGCLVTGNEDGVKHVARDVLYALQHIGYCIPPQADAGWIGEVGPGPSYGDLQEGSDVPTGFDTEFTNRNTTILCYNLMHMAAMLRTHGGFPTLGNSGDFDAEHRLGFPLDENGRPLAG